MIIDDSGYVSALVFLNILMPVSLLDHPKNIQSKLMSILIFFSMHSHGFGLILHTESTQTVFDCVSELHHAILFLFGASGLSIVSSITLALELILKAGKHGFH